MSIQSSLLQRVSDFVPPRVVSGSGSWLTDSDGKRYLDACGGAAVSCIGHSHPRVIEAIMRQAQSVAYAHSSFFTSDAAEALAEMLISHSPESFGKVYFVSGGSEAIESAIKLARQYFVEKGEPRRCRLISRRQSYHGNTLGALSVSGNVGRRELYAPVLLNTIQVSPCFAYRGQKDSETGEAYAKRLAEELEATIQEAGPETVMAFIAETVVGATAGAVEPVADYLRRVRDVCDKYGILLILDEVMCGAGRTGTFHAFEKEGVTPDILTNAKGLGGGYQPIGAVYLTRTIDETIRGGSGAFRHGHTYNAHAIACAAALAVQETIRDEGLIDRARESGLLLSMLLRQRFGDHPHIGDVRGRGLLQAIEFVADKESREPFDPSLRINARVKETAMQNGLCVYPGGGTADGRCGDHILLAPPYNATKDELELAVGLLAKSVDSVMSSLPVQP